MHELQNAVVRHAACSNNEVVLEILAGQPGHFVHRPNLHLQQIAVIDALQPEGDAFHRNTIRSRDTAAPTQAQAPGDADRWERPGIPPLRKWPSIWGHRDIRPWCEN